MIEDNIALLDSCPLEVFEKAERSSAVDLTDTLRRLDPTILCFVLDAHWALLCAAENEVAASSEATG